MEQIEVKRESYLSIKPRVVTSIRLNADDWWYCKNQGLKLSEIFRKGLEFIRKQAKNEENETVSKEEFERRVAFLNGKVSENLDILDKKECEIQGLRNKIAVLEGVLGNSKPLFGTGIQEKPIKEA